jgi:hypothetical protein
MREGLISADNELGSLFITVDSKKYGPQVLFKDQSQIITFSVENQ